MTTDKFDVEIDARGKLCPEPIMMLHEVVSGVLVGGVMKLISTDPSTQRDVQKFCQFLGHELLDMTETDKEYIFLIKKNA